jgi:hypothetical protein
MPAAVVAGAAVGGAQMAAGRAAVQGWALRGVGWGGAAEAARAAAVAFFHGEGGSHHGCQRNAAAHQATNGSNHLGVQGTESVYK